jgi:hypothetical protein
MLGLSGIGWMTISLTFGYVVLEIMTALSSVIGKDSAMSKHKWVTLLFSLSSLPMLAYPIIGMFLGDKWYIAPLFALGAFLISGKVLFWITGLLIRNPSVLFGFIYPLFATIQFVSAIFAYITWF